jgi:hypothetical protein
LSLFGQYQIPCGLRESNRVMCELRRDLSDGVTSMRRWFLQAFEAAIGVVGQGPSEDGLADFLAYGGRMSY